MLFFCGEKVVQAWFVTKCIILTLVPLWWLARVQRLVFISFSFLFSLPLLTVRVNLYLLAMLGRSERCQEEDGKCILKWAVRNCFDISDKGKGYCTQLFSSYLLIAFLVNHKRKQRNSLPWLACPMPTLIWQVGLAWHAGTKHTLLGVITTWGHLLLPLSPGVLLKQNAQFRRSPGPSPHHLFCKSEKCLLIPSHVCKETLILKWTLLTELLQKFKITDLEPSA